MDRSLREDYCYTDLHILVLICNLDLKMNGSHTLVNSKKLKDKVMIDFAVFLEKLNEDD